MSCIVITNDATELRSTLKYLHPYALLYKINTDEYEVVLDSTDSYDKGEVINWDALDNLDLYLKGRDEQGAFPQEEEQEVPIEEEQNPIGEGLRQRQGELIDAINRHRARINFHWEGVEENVPEENN